jgi:hypothetical protein
MCVNIYTHTYIHEGSEMEARTNWLQVSNSQKQKKIKKKVLGV